MLALVLASVSRSLLGQDAPGGRERAAAEDPGLDDERVVIERGREVGLGAFGSVRGERYVAVGDAPEAFLREAMRLCEGLAEDYLAHFRAKGFAVEPPAGRLTLVALAGPESFRAFLAEDPKALVGGVYDLETNRLVIVDQREAQGAQSPQARRANSVALFHEAMHQLTYNSGLLDRKADVPLAVSEGLAQYGETRRPDGRVRIGAVNAERLQVVASERRLMPLEQLLSDDSLLEKEETRQLAYATSWLWMHLLLAKADTAGHLRDYLSALRTRTKPDSRLVDAREHFGDLAVFDRRLPAYAGRLGKAR